MTMDKHVQKSAPSLKEWTIDHMEYVPRVSAKAPDDNGDKNFPSRLLSGRLGIYWQYLIRHARSRKQVQHIRDNLRIQEFQDAKNKKILQTNTSTMETDMTLISNPSRNDISITLEANTSVLSDRRILIKEYEDTKHILKKSKCQIQKVKMDIQSNLLECEELKNRFQMYQLQIDQNYEKLKFLGSLNSMSKESICAMNNDAKFLEHTVIKRFDYTKDKNNVCRDKDTTNVKTTLMDILKQSKNILNQATKYNNSAQRTFCLDSKQVDNIKQSCNVLVSMSKKSDPKDYYAASILAHEALLSYIRLVVRNLENEMANMQIENRSADPDDLESILNKWREEHVILAAKAKTIREEIKVVENDTHRQGKIAKHAISELIDSDNYYSKSKGEMKKLLQSYFTLYEKRARLKSLLKGISNKISVEKQEAFTQPNLKVLFNLSISYDNEMESKMGQINRVLQRNANLDIKINWIEDKTRNLLNTGILSGIRELLAPNTSNEIPTSPINFAKDRILRRFKNYMCYPMQSSSSLNLLGNLCGRDVKWLTKTNQNLLPFEKCSLNGSVIIEELLRLKLQRKDVLIFLEYAKGLKEKWILFDENSHRGSIEEKVRVSKDRSQLIIKLDDIIAQVTMAKKQFRMQN